MKRSLIVIIWAVLTITGVHSQNIYPNHKKEYSAIFEVGYGKDITYGKEDKFEFLTSHGINIDGMGQLMIIASSQHTGKGVVQHMKQHHCQKIKEKNIQTLRRLCKHSFAMSDNTGNYEG